MKEKISLTIFNTEKRKKEKIALAPGQDKLRIYTCGPTVYHYAHIGNFRTYVFEDLLRRTLKYFGFPVIQVMNLTDVDDKTIRGALAASLSLDAYTQKFKEAFFEDLKTLLIEPAEVYPEATAYIPQMIKMIETLLEKGVAYISEDRNVYYSIKTFPCYGRLSHLKLEDLQAGASKRVARDEYEKEEVTDFVLWKHYDSKRDGAIFWESPFGKGRPGWHLECSAMAISLLGETIDIHVGGVDNIFPHHENEIAQSEACSGHLFVRYWLHAEHLIVDGKKMSKSLGNFYTLRDLLQKGYSGREIRYLLLQAHYRTQLNFTFEGLEAARHSLKRIADFIERLRRIDQEGKFSLHDLIDRRKLLFEKALADDLNISLALASLFELIREVNTLCDLEKVSKKDAEALLHFFAKLEEVLSIFPLGEEHQLVPAHIQEAFNRREAARKEKNWKEADSWRDFMQAQGYLIEDSPSGSHIKKK